MATISIFNSKGGVGKTTCAIHLAKAAVDAGYRTLLWEVDGQGDSSWLLSEQAPPQSKPPIKWIAGVLNVKDLICPSRVQGLSLLAADTCMQRTNNFFASLVPGQTLARVFRELEADFDVIILDCPPGMGLANAAIMQFASLVVVPAIPSALAMRGLYQVRDFLTRHRGQHAPILPIFSMVDRRRKLHRAALVAQPDWPVVPMLSDLERASSAPLSTTSLQKKRSVDLIFSGLWTGIERKLRAMHQIRVRPTSRPEALAAQHPAEEPRETLRKEPATRYWQFQRYQTGAV